MATAPRQAPDGGPIASPRLRLKGVRMTPEMTVKVIGTNRVVNIHPELFDPDQHEVVSKPGKAKRARIDEVVEPETLTRENLASMSVKNLKKLPEWEALDNKERLTTKEAIISALLGESGEDEDGED